MRRNNNSDDVYGAVIMTIAIASVHLLNADLLCKSQILLLYLVRTSFEPASVMEFGFKSAGKGYYHPQPPSPFVIITEPES